MSNKTTAQRNARRLQRLTEDELGMRPKLRTCHNVMAESERDPTHSIEEHIATAFLAARDRLKASAEKTLSAAAAEKNDTNRKGNAR